MSWRGWLLKREGKRENCERERERTEKIEDERKWERENEWEEVEVRERGEEKKESKEMRQEQEWEQEEKRVKRGDKGKSEEEEKKREWGKDTKEEESKMWHKINFFFKQKWEKKSQIISQLYFLL